MKIKYHLLKEEKNTQARLGKIETNYGTYETPILEGLLDEDFVQQLKLSGTFNEDSFDRQYKRFCTIKIIENCWNTLRAI